MRFLKKFMLFAFVCILFAFSAVSNAQQKGTPVFGHNDPSKYFEAKNAHGGAGSLWLMELLPGKIFQTNILYIHRGIIKPHCGIGEHIHRNIEEMFMIFNAPAEFTVNGHTSLLPAGSTVLCQMGSSHGIYNNSDKTLEWMNMAIGKTKEAGAIDYGDSLTNQTLESPANFKWTTFDRSLLQPVTGAHDGKGTLLFRRMWDGTSTRTNWEWIDHVILPPGTSIGYHQHNEIEEVYYVLNGNGRMTVNDKTWDVGPGDATPCTLHDSHGIYNNTQKDLEIFVLGVSMKKGVIEAKNWGDDLTKR
jgi:mannose-6-phosphate isomerase-like protein (cupin superfamily)